MNGIASLSNYPAIDLTIFTGMPERPANIAPKLKFTSGWRRDSCWGIAPISGGNSRRNRGDSDQGPVLRYNRRTTSDIRITLRG